MAESNNLNHMSPDTSPNSVTRSGIRRVNNIPLILAILSLAVFTALIIVVAIKRSNDELDVPPQDAKRNTNTSTLVKDIIGSYRAGLIPAKEQIQNIPLPTKPVNTLEITSSTDHNPMTPTDPDEQQIGMLKMQEFQDAVKAKTAISVADQSDRISNTAVNNTPQSREEMLTRITDVRRQIEQKNANNPDMSYQAQLANIQANINNNSTKSLSQLSTNNRNNIQKSENAEYEDRWKLNREVQVPQSRFEIRAGSVISGIMISGINSDLPGQITGQVSQDVYDTATGKYLLIPQGTRLIGVYSSDVGYGQSAMMIAWQRLGFPDGKVLDIGSMPGADNAGYTGFRDEVNNHYLRLFTSAILLSGVTAGIAYNQNQNDSNNTNSNNPQQATASSELSKALGQQLGQVTTQMITKNMNIAPTLEIRPGYRFNITVVKDLNLTKPYHTSLLITKRSNSNEGEINKNFSG